MTIFPNWTLLAVVFTGCGQSKLATAADPCDTYFDALIQADVNCGKPAPTGEAYVHVRARFRIA